LCCAATVSWAASAARRRSDGTGQTRLTNDAATDAYPAWSPDGSKLVFQASRDGNAEIYSMNADGTGQTRLTNNAAFDGVPAWSPDGSKIAFDSDRDDGSHKEIYSMNADGTGQTNVTNNPATDQFPAWSPDGTKIAFESDRDGNIEIYVMNADGTGQTNLTSNAAGDSGAAWSPDGTKIAFSTLRDGNWEVYIMNADGTGQTNVTNDSAADQYPDWQPVVAPPGLPGPGGVDPGKPGLQPTPAPTPAVSKLNLRPSKFRAARSGASVARKRRRTPIGTTVSFVLSTDATVTFRAQRAKKGRIRGGKCMKPSRRARGRRCTRYVVVRGRFRVAGKAGKNRLKFTGRIAKRRLARGRYRLVATPSAAGKKGAAARASFKIK
jgi:hypothetical protein